MQYGEYVASLSILTGRCVDIYGSCNAWKSSLVESTPELHSFVLLSNQLLRSKVVIVDICRCCSASHFWEVKSHFQPLWRTSHLLRGQRQVSATCTRLVRTHSRLMLINKLRWWTCSALCPVNISISTAVVSFDACWLQTSRSGPTSLFYHNT